MRDPRYLKGIELFNRREFFDAHEVWEDLWREEHGEAHAFVQGLIQFATALHHFEAFNLKGAKLLYEGGMELMAGYRGVYWGLAVEPFLSSVHRCFAGLTPYAQADLPGRYHVGKEQFPVKIDPALIPIITLEPE